MVGGVVLSLWWPHPHPVPSTLLSPAVKRAINACANAHAKDNDQQKFPNVNENDNANDEKKSANKDHCEDIDIEFSRRGSQRPIISEDRDLDLPPTFRQGQGQGSNALDLDLDLEEEFTAATKM